MKFQLTDMDNGTWPWSDNSSTDLLQSRWNHTSYGLDMEALLRKDAKWRFLVVQMQMFATPVIITLGLLFNIAGVPVLSRPRLRVYPCSVFLVAMLVSDSCFLVALLLNWLGHFHVRTYARPGWCQALTLLTNMANFLCTWYPVSLAVERLVDRWALLRRVCGDCACRNAVLLTRMTVLGLLVVSVTVYVNTTLLVGVINVGTASICVPLPEFFGAVSMLDRIDIVFNGLLPCLVVLAAWIVLTRTLLINRATPQGLERAGYGDMWRRQRGLDRAVVALLLMLLLLQTPSSCLRLTHVIRECLGYDPAHSQVLEYTLQHVFQYLNYAALALKGVVLAVSWPEFRREAAGMMLSLKCRRTEP